MEIQLIVTFDFDYLAVNDIIIVWIYNFVKLI